MSKQIITFSLIAGLSVLGLSQICVGQEKSEKKEQKKQPLVKQAEVAEAQAYLGVGVSPLHPALATQLAETIGDGRGVLIAHVAKDSPAAKAGLRVHDVLVAFEKQDIYSTEQLVKLVRDSKPGRKISLTVVREGQEQKTTVDLGEIGVKRPIRRPTVFRVPFDEHFPKPKLFSRDLFRENTANKESWSHFESLNITKDKDGKYEAKITYKDGNKSLERTFSGTRDEVVKLIEEDKELPESARDHLLRGLDTKIKIRELFDPEQFFRGRGSKDLFNWPDVDF